MKVTLSAMIEKAECCIAAFLNFGNDKSRTNCVDRSGGDEDAVASRHSVPRDKIRDRSVRRSHAQLPRSESPLEAQGDLGFRRSAQDVPSFRLAVRQSDRPCVRVVRMNLNGKWLASEQQFEQ
jgi:hypothetical protein